MLSTLRSTHRLVRIKKRHTLHATRAVRELLASFSFHRFICIATVAQCCDAHSQARVSVAGAVHRQCIDTALVGVTRVYGRPEQVGCAAAARDTQRGGERLSWRDAKEIGSHLRRHRRAVVPGHGGACEHRDGGEEDDGTGGRGVSEGQLAGLRWRTQRMSRLDAVVS